MDITKCVNHECLLKENCLRWTCPSDENYQSYASFQPKDGKCEYLIPFRTRDGL